MPLALGSYDIPFDFSVCSEVLTAARHRHPLPCGAAAESRYLCLSSPFSLAGTSPRALWLPQALALSSFHHSLALWTADCIWLTYFLTPGHFVVFLNGGTISICSEQSFVSCVLQGLLTALAMLIQCSPRSAVTVTSQNRVHISRSFF